jgi:Putative esterase
MRSFVLAIAAAIFSFSAAAASPSFSVSFPAAMSAQPIDGHITLIVAKGASKEPRTLLSEDQPLTSPALFGLTVDGMKPGATATIDAKAFGWPLHSLSLLPDGDYTVQAVLNRYETFHLADGRVLKLPPEMGEGQHWAEKPGNLYSKPIKIHVDAAHPAAVTLALDQKIGPIAPKADTPFIRHIRIKSELLSKYWGRPVYLGAHVLLPFGFDTHLNAHYPLMVNHGHFPDDIGGFRTTPPDPNLTPDYSERFRLAGYNRIQQQEEYAFYQKWISPNFPRFLVIEIQHANPYYDDSYAVNSANLGPYGDAINKELIPYIEKKFRGLGQGWARFTYGGSTGGWEALATQVFYPDMYNGAFVACPDPIDFHAYETSNLYDDKNAYKRDGQFYSTELPSIRDYNGIVYETQRDANHAELAQGDHTRSGGQFDIWQAVFSPTGSDGYPKPIFDKDTGDIDKSVANYWRDHYDLTHIIQRDWATLGTKLAGKIHIYVGSADTYYLNDAVYYAQDVLEKLKNPAYGGEVKYGERAEHCWNGDPALPNAYSRLHYNFMYLPKILARIQATAPKGADLSSWRY